MDENRFRLRANRPRFVVAAATGRLPSAIGRARTARLSHRGQQAGEVKAMRKHIVGLGALAGLATLSGAAYATTATSNFQVKLTITAQCLVSATDMDFGSNGFITANIDQTSTVSVQCTNTTTYNVGFDKGTNGSSVTTRQMKGGPSNETINYALYSDSNRSVNWGQTIGTDTVAGTGNGSTQNITVYGRVPSQTTPKPGNYSDTITVTVTY